VGDFVSHRFTFALLSALAIVLSFPAAGHLRAQGESATAPRASSGAGSGTGSAAGGLDYEFFKDNVEPVFLKKRPGHARCVTCHAYNNVRLHLVPLSEGATAWNEVQSRQNFELIKRVAFPGNPESPLLVHPLLEASGGDFFHSGGKHFNSQTDPEWLMLKAFVMGETTAPGQ
jgi:hypothetical protein